MSLQLTASSTENSEHYVWGQVCDGWHLLKLPDLSVIQERVPPGAGEARHFHTRARQFFYVIKGAATLEFSEKSVTFSAGQGVHVPPGIEHRFSNASSEEVVFLVISSPSTAGDRTNVQTAP
jgi:mannose-6-phosphate isomerase-like protein (cupin superfamily)